MLSNQTTESCQMSSPVQENLILHTLLALEDSRAFNDIIVNDAGEYL